MTRWKRRTFLSNAVAALAATVALKSDRTLAASQEEQPAEHIIEIRAVKFAPEVQSAKTGDRITWVNNDIVPHTATASDKSWNTGTIPKGGSKTVTVTDGMSANYFCRFHPMMKAGLDLDENT